MSRSTSRRVLRLVLAGYLLLVARITLWPSLDDEPALAWVTGFLAWLHDHGLPARIDLVVVEALANVAMFVPLGLLLPVTTSALAGGRRWWAVGAGLGLSALIETCQLLFLPTRYPTVQDVVMNTLGALVGVVLLTLAARTRRPADRSVDRVER